MKNTFLYFFLLITLFFITPSYSEVGRGELKLSDRTVAIFMNYISGKTSQKGKSSFNEPLVFWVTEDGTDVSWWYCPEGNCRSGDTGKEKSLCERKTGMDCYIFARKRLIVWKNGINTGKLSKSTIKSKWSRAEVKTKLASLGFIEEEKKSVLKKKPKNNGSSQLDKLETLKKLFDDGLITPEEFLSRKKIILN